jgi:uncharacterized membrane protein
MRLKRVLLTSVFAAALAVTVGTTAAQSAGADGKAGAGATTAGGDRRVLAADMAAGKGAATAASAAVNQTSAAIKSRIVDFVQANGTKYTFGSYVDSASGKAVIETNAPSEVVSSLVGTSGALVEIRKRAMSDDFSRRDDIPAYWGGSGITPSAPNGHCSAGYVVKNSVGTRFMVTAGHCFSNGQTAVTELGGRVVGVVQGNGLPSQDMELIAGQSYGSSIYIGGVNSSVGAHIASAGDPVVGFNDYCHSGRTTGENCGHTVNDVNALVCTSSGCKSPVIAFTGGVLPQGGDSGSPLYAKSVSAPDKHIRGHIIAGNGVTEYAEKWSRVAARFGVTIVT